MRAGFQTFRSLASRLHKLGVEFQDKELLRDLVEKNKTFILSLNKMQLQEEGINSKGEEIMSYAPYSKYTIEQKKKKGQPFDRVTLFDTGRFQAGFYLEVGPSSFRISSHNGKTCSLVEKYGPYIFGLTDENKMMLVEEKFYPQIEALIMQYLEDEQ
jgi:hypothetical protein